MKGSEGHSAAGLSGLVRIRRRSPAPPTVVTTDSDFVRAGIDAQVAQTRAAATAYVEERAAEHFTTPDTEILAEVLSDFVSRGKFVRPVFAYLGWLCGRTEAAGALQAAASLEILHAFALIQDDVMDDSASRRGRPSVHVRLAQWAESRGGIADAAGIGRSAAILLSDLCLIWSERMLREADLPRDALDRARPVFDSLRAELAVGQFHDLLNEDIDGVTQDGVLAIARSKSGNYTVLRPLEFGAALAGCPAEVTRALRAYGEAIGEAFQLRDDLLGVFGRPEVTGKPVGDDLRQRKATTVVVATRDLADTTQRRRFHDLIDNRPSAPRDQDAWVADWQHLVRETGAEAWIEQAITTRVTKASRIITSTPAIPAPTRQALLLMAHRSTTRTH